MPNGEIFTAKTERDMAILAVKYGVVLPQHLAHLPSMPAPRSEEEQDRLKAEMAAAEAAVYGEAAVKERAPRKARMGLSDVTALGTPKSSPQRPPPSDRPVGASPTQPAGDSFKKGNTPPRTAAAMDDGYLAGAAVKEAAPSVRRKKKAKSKAKAAAGPSPATAAASALVASPDDFDSMALKDRAPSKRRAKNNAVIV